MNRISIRNLQTKIPVPQARIKNVVRQTLRYFRMTNAELSVVFVTEAHMKRLNSRHLNHKYPTDILTFDYRVSRKDPLLRAEIVLCPSVAMRNAHVFNTDVRQEIDRYLIHGILHLCGYDDNSPVEKSRMTGEEDRILGRLRRRPGA